MTPYVRRRYRWHKEPHFGCAPGYLDLTPFWPRDWRLRYRGIPVAFSTFAAQPYWRKLDDFSIALDDVWLMSVHWHRRRIVRSAPGGIDFTHRVFPLRIGNGALNTVPRWDWPGRLCGVLMGQKERELTEYVAMLQGMYAWRVERLLRGIRESLDVSAVTDYFTGAIKV